jgi:hypothetical protein
MSEEDEKERARDYVERLKEAASRKRRSTSERKWLRIGSPVPDCSVRWRERLSGLHWPDETKRTRWLGLLASLQRI